MTGAPPNVTEATGVPERAHGAWIAYRRRNNLRIPAKSLKKCQECCDTKGGLNAGVAVWKVPAASWNGDVISHAKQYVCGTCYKNHVPPEYQSLYKICARIPGPPRRPGETVGRRR